MKDSTRKLLRQIKDAHDWEDGQVWGGGGTRLSSTDTCRLCGLIRHWRNDTQNGVLDHYEFETHGGERLTIADAAALTCIDAQATRDPSHDAIVSALDNYTLDALRDMQLLIGRLITREEESEAAEEVTQ